MDLVCPRCKAADETTYHMIWECPCNRDVGEDVERSDYLKPDAAALYDQYPCLFFRGLLLRGYVEVPRPGDEV